MTSCCFFCNLTVTQVYAAPLPFCKLSHFYCNLTETNCKRRGTGNFDKAVNGVKCLVNLKKEYGYNTEICIKPIFETSTKEEWFYLMTELAIKLGVDKIKFSNPERSLYHEKGHYEKEKEHYF